MEINSGKHSSCLRMALSSSESLTGKLITVLVGGILLFLGVAFEVRRIAREEDYAETAWKNVFSAVIAFGSFGWSGEAPRMLLEVLKNRKQ